MALLKKAEEFKGNDRTAVGSFDTPPTKEPLNGPMVGGVMHDAATIVNALILSHSLKSDQALVEFEKVLNGILLIRSNLEI